MARQKITPCLWFDGDAEAAVSFYVTLPPDPRVDRIQRSPDGGLTPAEAIRAYTLGGAVAAGCESGSGSISPGKVADLAVLSSDPTGMDAAALASLRAERVFVGGVEWEGGAGAAPRP